MRNMPDTHWKELLAADRAQIWHPYSAMPGKTPVFPLFPPRAFGCASPTEKNSSTVYRPGGAPSMATIILF